MSVPFMASGFIRKSCAVRTHVQVNSQSHYYPDERMYICTERKSRVLSRRGFPHRNTVHDTLFLAAGDPDEKVKKIVY